MSSANNSALSSHGLSDEEVMKHDRHDTGIAVIEQRSLSLSRRQMHCDHPNTDTEHQRSRLRESSRKRSGYPLGNVGPRKRSTRRTAGEVWDLRALIG